MTNEEQKLREIAEKWKWDAGGTARLDECLSDLTALISEGYYPKEFIEWATNNAECDGDGKWYVYSIAAIINSTKVCKYETALLTTNELFNYWANNEK